MKSKYLLKLNLQTFAAGTKTLEELQQERAAIHDKQEALVVKAQTENRGFNSEEETEYNNLEEQFLNLNAEIEKMEQQATIINKTADRSAALNSTAKPFRPSAVAGAPVQPKQLDNGGFKNLGEMVHAVRFGDAKGRLNNLPVGQGEGGGFGVPEAFHGQLFPNRIANEWEMGTGENGGYALPPTQFRPDILKLNPESAIVRSRATVIPAGSPPDGKVTMPALVQGSKGVYGGVEVAWIGEGELKPETDANLREVSLEPHEVAATMTITDKLLRNWQAANTFISSLLQGAMNAAEDIAFLTGNGVGKPSGVSSAAGAIVVNREAANQITFLDTLQMRSKLLPESLGGAVWVANLSVLPQIATLQDPAGNYIFIQGDATKGIPTTLCGIPITFTGKTPILGKKGDLMLLDLSHYLIKDGSGPYIAASEHVLFRQNKTVIKVFWNVDGKPWVIEPLTLEDGDTKVTPYVILGIPAVGGG